MRYLAIGAFASVIFAGCASQEQLPSETAGSVRIDKVSISISPEAPLSIGQDIGCGELTNQVCVARRLKSNLKQGLDRRMSGDRSTELIVGVSALEIEGTVKQVIFGSGHKMTFLAQLVDLNTRDVIAVSDFININAGYVAGGVISVALDAVSRDPMTRLSEEAAEEVCDWLSVDCDL